jgi:transcriptional regulator with XRE-family HTH domain
MSLEQWEKKVLETPGAEERVREIEDELRLATGLTALREQAGVSQRELAQRLGVSQPRIAAIERSRNVTIDVLEQYVEALGANLEVSVVQGRRRTSLLGGPAGTGTSRRRTPTRKPQRSSDGTPPIPAKSTSRRRRSA